MPKRTLFIIGFVAAVTLILIILFVIHARNHKLPAQSGLQPRTSEVKSTAAIQEMAALRRAADASPNDAQKRLALASYCINHNMYADAADQLAVVVRSNPDDVRSQLKLGDLSLNLKRFGNAETNYRQVTLKSPYNILAWQGLCAALIQQHRYFEAKSAGQRALVLDKNNAGSQLLHATALLNFALQFPDPHGHINDVRLAQIEFAGLTGKFPDSGELYYELGRAEQALLHREAPIKYLERAHLLMPQNADAAYALAVSYRQMNREDKALQLMEEMDAKLPDSPEINEMLGLLLIDSNSPGAPQRAVQVLQTALRAKPDDAGIMEKLGSAFEKLNDLPNARRAYERATQANPNRALAFQKLALVYTRLGEPKLAKLAADYAQQMTFNDQQLHTIIELSSQHPDDVNLHLLIAERYRSLKMDASAREEYYVVQALDPKNKRVPKEFASVSPASGH